jgi:transketolase
MTTITNHRPPATFADLPRLMSLMTGDDKHDQAATSTLDVLWVLYDRVLRVTPQTAGDDARDRFVMSKGHGPMAYYAVLAAKGFLDPADLPGFGAFGSILGLHPDRVLVPGVEVSSGSLGHGLPLAVGMALGLRARSLRERRLADARVFVLIGDAELDEGSNHEAIAFARAARLDTLHVVVVDNASSTHGWPGGVETRFAVEGWSVSRISGRDHDALEAAFTVAHPGRPHMVAAVVEPKSSRPTAPPTATPLTAAPPATASPPAAPPDAAAPPAGPATPTR